MEKKKIILTGGGTAGHIMPCVALIDELKNDYQIHYVGSKTGMENSIISGMSQVTFHSVTTVKLRRSLSPKNLLIPFKLLMGRHQAKKLLKKIKPAVIFSKGGFAALPVTLAAKKIPIICHESDMSLGLSNRLIKRKARYICTSFSTTAPQLKNSVYTGLPLRKSIYKSKVLRQSSKPRLLVIGGSLGSKALNDCLEGSIDQLLKHYEITHITGKGKATKIIAEGYKQMEFCADMGALYAKADLAVSRGGSTALFELVALKIPAVIVPLPKGVSRGDQIENAKYFEQKGVCRVLDEQQLNADNLLKALDAVANDGQLRQKLGEFEGADGLQKVKGLIVTTVEEK